MTAPFTPATEPTLIIEVLYKRTMLQNGMRHG
jgi:hypothetical protein